MSLPRRKRTVVCVLLALGLSEAAAAAPGWDCQKSGADGKEWVCVSTKNKPAKPAEQPAEAEPALSAPQEAKPAPVVETPEPKTVDAPAFPAVTARPQPNAAAPPRPAVADPDEAPPNPPPAAVARPAPAEANPALPAQAAPIKPPSTEMPAHATAPATKTGWNCRPGQGKEWDCALSGSDPRGEAHVVGDDTSGPTPNWKESGDMTREDEQRFSSILAHMPANPWALSCGRSKREWTQGSDFLLSASDRILREGAPLEIQSERAEMLNSETSNFQGTAELVHADQRLYGDFVTHNRESGAMNAQGNVVYREKGLSFASDTAFMKLQTDEGVLRNAQFVLETVPARGTARLAHIDSKTKSRYDTATYTTCPPGNQDWLLHATQATIDKDSGQGSATNAWLEFKGVPFLYTPFMSFPVDDRRKSGFLAPMIGYSEINGFDLTLPYYFNLAPNYDLTLMPRVLSNRGELLRGDFRYLSEIGKGRMFVDILPWDRIKQETRGQIGWVDDSRFTSKLSSHVDLHLVSDDRYIYELGNLLAINNTTFLRSWGDLRYDGGEFLGGWYSANMLVDYYQSLDPTVHPADEPYRRMPQITFNFGREVAGTGLQFQNSIEVARFDQPNKVNGERLNLRPRLYYPFRDTAGYVTPSLALQHTEYWLHNLGVGEASSFSRTAPIFSVDSGAYFERDFNLFDSSMQQTLEPRLFYLYVPKVNQPYDYNYGLGADGTLGYQGLNFDANEYDFNFYQLFRENRFAGVDRLSDANNITPALTTRIISQDSGLERLKLSVGKVFYLTDPQVVLTLNGPQTTVKDNVVGEVSSMLSEHWSLRGTGQWNPNKDRIDRGQIALHYNNYANNLLNLSYRYRRDPYAGSVPPYPVNPNNPVTINQTDISTRLPLGAGWFVIGRWQYDLASQVTVETMAGVERETCCWRVSLVGLRYINGALGQVVTADNVSTNNAVFFQFELKGLGRFGDQIDNLLVQNFSGYRMDYDLPSPSH
ncbi:MAG: LPS-assembly protein LptD [Candidatus Methylumidiphilus sp.]